MAPEGLLDFSISFKIFSSREQTVRVKVQPWL